MDAWGWWWCGILFTAAPLLAFVVWHCNDAFYHAAFALNPARRRGRLPPGHMGVPLLGEIPALLWYFMVARRPDGFIDAKRRAYGEGASIYRTHLFGSPAVIVCSPAANRFVLQNPDCFVSRWPSPEMLGLTSHANVEGRQHARIRGCIIAALNQPGALGAFARAVQPRVEVALRSWADKGTIGAGAEIKKVMFENICKTYISMDSSPLMDKMEKWFVGLIAGLMAFPMNIPGTASHHAVKCRRKLNAVFREELERRRRSKETPIFGDHQEQEEYNDLMSRLMAREDEQGKKLRDEEVVDIIVTLVIGAYDYTSTAVLWATYHLAKSPDALVKLRAEAVAVRRGKDGSSSFLTCDDIPKMKYTAKVVEEGIRVANSAPMIHRVARKDVEFEGYTIPEGWRIVVWLRSLHTDAKYFKDPLCFNPDRWDEPAKPGTYWAFGGGYRACPANMLARLQITIMLYHLSLSYEWKLLNPDARIVYLPTPRPEDDAAMVFGRLGTSL